MKSELDRFCEEHHITCESCYGGNKGPMPDGFPSGTHPYSVTLRRHNGDTRRQLTVDFFTGPTLYSEPTPADVLSSLLLDTNSVEYSSFEEWCADLGYDADSRKAERIYRSCEAMNPKLHQFLGDLYESAMGYEH